MSGKDGQSSHKQMHYTQQKCASKLHHCTQIRPIKNKKAC